MIYFFINILMYLIVILILMKYFLYKNDANSFIIVLFNMNIYFFFIYQNINFIYGLIMAILSLILYRLLQLFKKDNKEIILIRDGNINFHEIINNYSYFKLINYLKIRHLKLDEISYCILKNNELVVIKNNEVNKLPVSIILDGKVLMENLRLINRDNKWLTKELIKKNMPINNINYAYFWNDKLYFVKK